MTVGCRASWTAARSGRIRRRRVRAMAAADIERMIKESFPDASVSIDDLAGDGDHYAATVVSEAFRGKSRVEQHKMVYEALKSQIGSELHAIALKTSCPG